MRYPGRSGAHFVLARRDGCFIIAQLLNAIDIIVRRTRTQFKNVWRVNRFPYGGLLILRTLPRGGR